MRARNPGFSVHYIIPKDLAVRWYSLQTGLPEKRRLRSKTNNARAIAANRRRSHPVSVAPMSWDDE